MIHVQYPHRHRHIFLCTYFDVVFVRAKSQADAVNDVLEVFTECDHEDPKEVHGRIMHKRIRKGRDLSAKLENWTTIPVDSSGGKSALGGGDSQAGQAGWH